MGKAGKLGYCIGIKTLLAAFLLSLSLSLSLFAPLFFPYPHRIFAQSQAQYVTRETVPRVPGATFDLHPFYTSLHGTSSETPVDTLSNRPLVRPLLDCIGVCLRLRTICSTSQCREFFGRAA